jgi:outer membrane lipoprotein LolB
MKRSFMIIGLLLLMQGCATVQTKPEIPPGSQNNKSINWKQRQQKLNHLSTWQLNGRVAVTYKDENWPFGIQWDQNNANSYTMNIKHPLTRSVVALLSKSSGGVTLRAENGRIYRDTSAERLLERQLGIKVPLEGLQYWVRGLTAPQYTVNALRLDNAGRAKQFQQGGWLIQFSNYKGASYDAMPGKINVSRTSPELIRVKMLIKQWRTQ